MFVHLVNFRAFFCLFLNIEISCQVKAFSATAKSMYAIIMCFVQNMGDSSAHVN